MGPRLLHRTSFSSRFKESVSHSRSPFNVNSPPSSGLAPVADTISMAHQESIMEAPPLGHDQETQQDGSSERIEGWNPSTLNTATILQNPVGVDLKTVEDSARHILGKNISDYLAGWADEDQRLLHVEHVFRPELVARFQQRQKQIKEELMQLPEELLRSRCTESGFEGRLAQAWRTWQNTSRSQRSPCTALQT